MEYHGKWGQRHFHNFANSAWANRCALHPSSWSAHLIARYQVFQGGVWPRGPWSVAHLIRKSHPCPCQSPWPQEHAPLHRSWHPRYKNHDFLDALEVLRPLPWEHRHQLRLLPWPYRGHWSELLLWTTRQKLSARHRAPFVLLLGQRVGPGNQQSHT